MSVATALFAAAPSTAGTWGGVDDLHCRPSAAHPSPVILLHGLGANGPIQVRAETGAAKVDLVGHSEGAFESLLVPKVLHSPNDIDRVVALAPPTHGATASGSYLLIEALNLQPQVKQVLTAVGCPACAGLLPGGAGVTALNAGPIAQHGIAYTVIASRSDEIVTPHESVSAERRTPPSSTSRA
jgi:hypothetical protein